MGIGAKIKELIKTRNITIKQLAEITGIPVNTLYSIIKRDSERVRAETVQTLADALGVTPSYLLGFDDRIQAPDRFSPEELAEIKEELWAAYKDASKETVERPLLSVFWRLNDKGQQKLIEYAEILVGNPEYQK